MIKEMWYIHDKRLQYSAMKNKILPFETTLIEIIRSCKAKQVKKRVNKDNLTYLLFIIITARKHINLKKDP